MVDFKEFVRRWRRWIVITAGVAAACTAILIASPYAIQLALSNWLEGDNERSVSIDDVDFNPFSGRIRIEGVIVQSPGDRGFRLDQLFAEVAVVGLLRKRVDVHRLEIGPGQADLEVKDGRLISAAGFAVPDGGTPDEEVEADGEETGWQIGLADVQIGNVDLLIRADDTDQRVRVASATVSNLAMWRPEDPASISMRASLPGGDLRLSGRLTPFAQSPSTDFSAELSAVDLAPIAQLLPRNTLPRLSGTVTGVLEINASAAAEQVDTKLAGNLTLEDFSVDQGERRLSADKLSWKGEVDADIGEPSLEVLSTGVASAVGLIVQQGVGEHQTKLRIRQAVIGDIDSRLTVPSNGAAGFGLAGAIELTDIDGEQANRTITDQAISWRGRVDGVFKPDGEMRLELAGTLETDQLEIGGATDSAAPASLSVGRLAAEDIRSLIECRGATCTADHDMAVRVEQLGVQTHDLEITNDVIHWRGRTEGVFQSDGELGIDFDGAFASEGLLVKQGGDEPTAARFSSGNLKFDNVKTRLRLSEGNLTASLDSEIEAVALSGQRGDAKFSNERTTWTGNFTTEVSPLGAVLVRGDGKLENGLLELVPPLSGLQLSQEGSSWEGNFELRADAGAAPVVHSMNAVAAVRGLSVVSNDLDLKVLEFQNLQIEGLAMSGPAVLAGALVVDQLKGLSPLPAQAESQDAAATKVLDVDRLTIEGIRAELPGRVTADQVTVSGTTVELARQENGEIELLGSLLRLAEQIAGEETEPSDKPTTFAIARWVANDSRVILTDRNVNPPARFVLFPVNAELSDIDSAVPDQEVKIALKTQVGKYGGFEATGHIKPFTERLNLDVDGTVAGFELTAISGYARKHLGYDIARGRLDADIDAVIADGRLQAESKLVLSKLQVEPTDPQRLDPLNKRLELPLETALSMLRDEDDVIRLSVPVGGDLASPQFDFADAINQAVGGAMKKTISTTLKLAFPIGGAIFSVVKLAGETRLKLEPLSYQAGIGALPPASETYLAEVEKLLKARPGIELSICGVATEQDRSVLQDQEMQKLKLETQRSSDDAKPKNNEPTEKIQQLPTSTSSELPEIADDKLLELAQSRGEAVKDHLIERLGISEDRLFLCAPKIEKGDSAEPRVDLLI